MEGNERNLDWLILTQSEFLYQFGINKNEIIADYNDWEKKNPNKFITNYFFELLRRASLYNIKNADTEEEFYNSKLLLDSKMLEYHTSLENESKSYLLEQIHFDKLLISRLTLPFKFDVQIDTSNCCTYCAKKSKRIESFEKVLEKKYLPFANCKREEGCCCSYSIVPLSDETGKLIPRDFG